jgi:hypothetical protein
MNPKVSLLAALSLIGISQGSVTLGFSTTTVYVSGFQNGAGSINGPEARMVWGVVVDGEGDGFDGAGPTIPYDDGFTLAYSNTGTALNRWDGTATDDRLYIASAVMASNTFANDGTAVGDNRILTLAAIQFAGSAGVGDRFAVIWFDTTTLGGTAGEGLKYGLLENINFTLPNDGFVVSYASSFEGADPSKPLTAALDVPEASTALLGLLGVVGLARRRR